MSEIITVPVRSVETITTEIVSIANQTAQVLLLSACEMGKRMLEAKELCTHGQWSGYLEDLCGRLGISTSTAHNWMRLYQDYGEIPNLQAIGNLTYTKAVKLLSLPESDREQLARDNDLASMTTRELEQAIREKKEALAAAEKLQAELDRKTAENQSLSKQVAAEAASGNQARKELEALRAKPAISEADREKIREEGAAAARALLSGQMETAGKALADAQRQIEELKKSGETQLQVLGDPDGAAFEVYIGELSGIINKMHGHYLKAKGRNPALTKKMVRAFRGITTKLDELTKQMEVGA